LFTKWPNVDLAVSLKSAWLNLSILTMQLSHSFDHLDRQPSLS